MVGVDPCLPAGMCRPELRYYSIIKTQKRPDLSLLTKLRRCGTLRTMIKKFAAAFVLCFVLVQNCWAFWVWTPESRQWTNPKNMPKESPQEQLKFAKSYYEAKDYGTAYQEFKKLVQYYVDAMEAPEAQYHMGLCLEATERYYEAYKAYQKIIDKYPFSDRTQEVLQREYIVAQKLLDSKKTLVGIDFTLENSAIEVFEKVVANSPHGKYAPVSQYKIGLVYKAKGYFKEASDEFQKVLDNYPASEWAEPAKFQIALCAAKSSLAAVYDQTLTQEAKDKFEQFVRSHPDAELRQEAQDKISQLKEKEAESNFQIAKFYEKQQVYESAKIYYRFVVENFPESPWTKKALIKLEALEKGRL
jgi:outer membrane protein assembly factor BamD